MTTTNETKLKTLYTSLPAGSPITSAQLAKMGISADLAFHYVRSCWLHRLARGVLRKPPEVQERPSGAQVNKIEAPPSVRPELQPAMQLLGRYQQPGQHAMQRDILRHAKRIDADVERRADTILVIGDGHRKAADMFLELALDPRPALLAVVHDRLLEHLAVGQRALGVFLQAGPIEIAVELALRHPAEEHAAHRRDVRRKAGADDRAAAHHCAHRVADHVDHFGAVQHRERAGLLHIADQLLEDGMGVAPERRRRRIGIPKAQNLGCEEEQALLSTHETELFQRVQQPPRARAR